MATIRRKTWLTEEIANFLASSPSREQLLDFRPSPQIQDSVRELLEKTNAGHTTQEEQWELDQFEHAEMLMQLIKARVRARKAAQA